jgi:hypothetical protein
MIETQGDRDVRTVLDYDQRLLDPEVSRTDLETLLHPDFTEVIPSGRCLTRSQIIAVLTAKATTKTGRDTSPRKAVELRGVQLSDSMIMVTYVSEQGERRVRRVTLWLRSGQDWQAYYHQSTPVEPGN